MFSPSLHVGGMGAYLPLDCERASYFLAFAVKDTGTPTEEETSWSSYVPINDLTNAGYPYDTHLVTGRNNCMARDSSASAWQDFVSGYGFASFAQGKGYGNPPGYPMCWDPPDIKDPDKNKGEEIAHTHVHRHPLHVTHSHAHTHTGTATSCYGDVCTKAGMYCPAGAPGNRHTGLGRYCTE